LILKGTIIKAIKKAGVLHLLLVKNIKYSRQLFKLINRIHISATGSAHIKIGNFS
jgi:hypothetical protein